MSSKRKTDAIIWTLVILAWGVGLWLLPFRIWLAILAMSVFIDFIYPRVLEKRRMQAERHRLLL